MKKMLCLLVGVVIFLGINIPSVMADFSIHGKIHSIAYDIVDNNLCITVIEDNNSKTPHYFQCEGDTPLTQLIMVAYQTQSVCYFHGDNNGHLEIISFNRDNSITNDTIWNAITNPNSALMKNISSIKSRGEYTFYYAYQVYRKFYGN